MSTLLSVIGEDAVKTFDAFVWSEGQKEDSIVSKRKIVLLGKGMWRDSRDYSHVTSRAVRLKKHRAQKE